MMSSDGPANAQALQDVLGGAAALLTGARNDADTLVDSIVDAGRDQRCRWAATTLVRLHLDALPPEPHRAELLGSLTPDVFETQPDDVATLAVTLVRAATPAASGDQLALVDSGPFTMQQAAAAFWELEPPAVRTWAAFASTAWTLDAAHTLIGSDPISAAQELILWAAALTDN